MRHQKKKFLVFVGLILASTMFAFGHVDAADKKQKERLAVLDFEAKYKVESGLAEALSITLRDAIYSYGDYAVMSREDIRAVASREQLLQAMGCDEGSACLVDFGRAIGTRFMVTGAIARVGSTYTVSLRMLDTKGESAGVVNRVSESCKCSEDDLIGTVKVVSAKLMGKEPPEVLAIKQAAETEELAVEKKTAEKAEKEKKAVLTEERRKAAEAEKNKLAFEKQKTEELEHQYRAEEEKLKLLAETENFKKEKAVAEAERAKLTEERKQEENETTRKLGEVNKKIEENIVLESRAAVVLRSKPIKVKEPELIKFINNYNFFEKRLNVSGSFENSFIDNGITITDKKTGLIWQKNGSPTLLSYFRAKAYVKKLNKSKFGGFSDWRLPTLEELASLLEENTVDDMHVDKCFDTSQSKLWSADIPDNYSGYDQYGTNYILNLKEGYFVKSIFIIDSFSGEGRYTTNFENYVRVVRTIQNP